jgi:hypothetical protein
MGAIDRRSSGLLKARGFLRRGIVLFYVSIGQERNDISRGLTRPFFPGLSFLKDITNSMISGGYRVRHRP